MSPVRTKRVAPPRTTLTLAEFGAACRAIGQTPNPEQQQLIDAAAGDDLHIVAGPGTGKTSSLTLRILKCVLVDGLRPAGIVATTFTVKAAAELRSRLLTRGFALMELLGADERLPAQVRERVRRLDINQIVTNTVDGVCQQVLRDHREPGTTNPVIIDEFVASTLLLREGLFAGGRHRDGDLDAYLGGLQGGRFGWNIGRKRDVLRTVWDRRFQDQIDWDDFCNGAAPETLKDSISDYAAALADRGMVDFAMLEQTVLERLRAGRLNSWADGVQAIFVDEYQDTNLLQESLYFALAERSGASLTIVGDDDQSLYRFRGATVDLFRDFPDRVQAALRRARPSTIFLRRNYRSTANIVDFVNGYAALDSGYQAARVAGKPPLIPCDPAGPADPPVMAMFRQDCDTLAGDLAQLLSDVFQGRGYRLPSGDRLRKAQGGAIGDAALLCSSPAEADFGGRRRLPGLLRDAMSALPEPLEVFNPRGEDVADIPLVAMFGGLLLEAIDPDGSAEAAAANALGSATMDVFAAWRQAAQAELARSWRLAAFHSGWAARQPRRGVWPRSVPALKLIYALAHFFPELHDDPEGQIYLEIFTRQLDACSTLGRYRADILAAPAEAGWILSAKKELLTLFLGPIAAGGAINEELIEAFPRNRLPVLSIHQAKGLEFPLVIVDVGSDFRTNHHTQAFKRFPRDGGLPHRLEDGVRPHSPLSTPTRSAQDRAFDDLYRQYFVAFSRPETVLILAGLDGSRPGSGIHNVATGMRRDGVNPWARNAPFVEI